MSSFVHAHTIVLLVRRVLVRPGSIPILTAAEHGTSLQKLTTAVTRAYARKTRPMDKHKTHPAGVLSTAGFNTATPPDYRIPHGDITEDV